MVVIIMRNMKNNKLGIFAIFMATALVIGTLAVAGNHDLAFATKHKKNHSDQDLDQAQFSHQSSSCNSGKNTTHSCNNVDLQFDANKGNLVTAQQ